MLKKAVLVVLFAFVGVSFVVDSVLAQQTSTGSITGTVRDSSQAVIPGVEVQVTNMATEDTRNTITDDTGHYSVGFLAPGRYRIEFALTGFKTLVHEGVTVTVTERAIVNVVLEVTAKTETVTVQAEGEILQTNSSTEGRVVDSVQIKALPLSTRNFTQLTALSPGSSIALPDTLAIGNGTQNVYTNGGNQLSNSYTIDGIDAGNSFSGTAARDFGMAGVAVPSVEIIQQFKVQTSLYDASFGRKAGANISVVTKSGTSEFHGSGYNFFRNDKLNANNFFFNALGTPRPVLRQNQFGGTLGGPIVEGRTFFFISYEGMRQTNGASRQSSISTLTLPPIPAERTPASLGAVFGGQRGAFGGVPIAANGSNISPVALALLNVKVGNGGFSIPSPQRSGPGTNYAVSVPASYNQDEFAVNIDHQLTADNRLTGKYFFFASDQRVAFFFSNIPGYPQVVQSDNQNVSLSDIHIFGSNRVNEARVGYVRFVGANRGDPIVTDKDVGINRSTAAAIPGIARITVTGGNGFVLGNPPTETKPTTNVFSLSDTFSFAMEGKGRHDFRIGGESRREQHNIKIPSLQQMGIILFRSFPDFLLGMPGGPAGNGTRFSNLFVSGIGTGTGNRWLRSRDQALFIADDWKVSPQLTLNLGLRWEFLGALSEEKGRNSAFDPRLYEVPAPGTVSAKGFVQPKNTLFHVSNTPLRRNTLLDDADTNDFAPRFGFAYRPFSDSNVVLRGGYGIFYERLAGRPQLVSLGVRNPPLFQGFQLGGPQNVAASFSNPFPPLPDASDFPIPFQIPGAGVRLPPLFGQFLDPHNRDPYIQQYSLNLQFSFTQNLLFEVGYHGSKSTKLQTFFNENQSVLASPESPVNGQTTNNAGNAVARRPFVGLNPLANSQNTATSNYNALQASLTKRFGSGLSFLASYTYSRSLSTIGTGIADGTKADGFSNGAQDARIVRQDGYGLNTFDRTQRFVFSYSYQLPSPQAGNTFIAGLLGGWQASGIIVAQSGTPFSINDNRGGRLFTNGSGRASFAEGADINTARKSGSTQSRLTSFFNTAAFTTATAIGDGGITSDGFPVGGGCSLPNGQPNGNCTIFGTTGRNILRGPGQTDVDLALTKRTSVTESTAIEFRAEFFNLFNVTNFSNPGGQIRSAGTFGIIGNTSAPPRVIQFALKFIF